MVGQPPQAVFCVLALFLTATECASAQQQKMEIPKPEILTLDTKDGVILRCAYYPGGVIEKSRKDEEYERKPGKEVVPVILLHGFGGRRGEYDFLASVLQRRGHAVMVPDLRGHGGSRVRRLPNGAEQTLDADRFRTAELQSMTFDVDRVKKFLLDKNNSGDLNIELLCVVGSQMGATIALNWAMRDWNRPQLPSFKQGRDVKALVLLSPEQSFKGMTPNAALRHPVIQKGLAMMIVAGNGDRTGYRDAKSIHNRLEKFHEEPEDRKEFAEKKTLFLIEPDTSLSGTKLVDPRARLPVFKNIDTFINWRLVRRNEFFTWSERKNPLNASE